MPIFRYLTLLSLFVFHLADANKVNYPEAYAGLNPSSYHLISLDQNKSGLISFKLNETQIQVPIDLTKSSTNISFSHPVKGGYISATKGTGSLFGELHLHNKHYILTTNHAGIWAVELPTRGLQYNDCGFDHVTQTIDHQAIAKALNQTDKAAGTIVDILVIHDQAFSDRYPGDLMQARVDQYFNITNQTFANSGIDLAVRQVGLEQVNYNFDDANVNALNLMQQSLDLGIGAVGFETLPSLVDATGPDLVIFMRTHNIEARGNCGVAFYPEVDQGNNFNITYGVNVIADGISSWSICTDQLVAHEIGHNLGAGHHNADVPQRFLPDGAGFARVGQYGTVMGSFGTGQPDRFYELNYFSNPAIFCGGNPCGINGQSNNTNVINQVKSSVAAYRNSTLNIPLPDDFSLLLTDQDNDGVNDQGDEFPFDPIETTDSDNDGIGDNSDAFPNLASEQFDFDGDDIGDNSDFDDDNDGILDQDDDFPLDSSEVKDSDQDGVGDIADDFVFEADETTDSDDDGIGNNADQDDDNDGIHDINADRQDLLVISVGNNRILRFDAQTGLAKGIEVLPENENFTFQSDLTYDGKINQLFYTSSSHVKSLNLMDLYGNPKLLIPAYSNNNQAQLGTGFPTAIATNGQSDLLTAKLRATSLDIYHYNNFSKPVQGTHAPFENVEQENIIDIYHADDFIYSLGQERNYYRSNLSGTFTEQIGNANLVWMTDPYAFIITENQTLLHSDQGRNKIVMTDGQSGTFAGIFADLAVLGYSNPTGIELSQDGRVLVAVSDQNAILEFDLISGDFLGELVKGSGLDQPHKILLVPQLDDRFHQDENKVLRPNAGNWFNPATSGRGFNIGIFDNRLQVLWFTYDLDGSPIWYTAADFLEGHEFETELLKTSLNSEGVVSVESIGQISLTFEHERQAFMSWQIGSASGSETIYWLQFSTEPEDENYTGMWSRPDTPGWGTAVITNGDKTVVIPFIYDNDGEPRWLISNVVDGLQPFNFDMSAVFSDTLCPTCSGDASATLSPAGSMMFDLSSQAYWDSDIQFPVPMVGDWSLDQTELIRISSEPTRPR